MSPPPHPISEVENWEIIKKCKKYKSYKKYKIFVFLWSLSLPMSFFPFVISMFLIVSFLFYLKKFLNIFGKLVPNSFGFCLSAKLFTSPLSLRALLHRVFLVVGSSLSALEIHHAISS